MESQTLEAGAKDCAERLLNEPEVKNYIARILRIAFMEGCVWSKEQQLTEMKARMAAAQATQTGAEVTTSARS